MIPLRDTVSSRSFPFVNLAIVVVNVLVFLFEVSLPDPDREKISPTDAQLLRGGRSA